MQLTLFYLAAAIMLGFGILVVLNRNPVASALSLVVSFVGLAGLFIMLDAHFLGIIQILVYAGAVMVLFLFIIMLLDLKEEERRRIKLGGLIAALVAVAAIGGIFYKVISESGARLSSGLPTPTLEGATAPLGKLLFTRYLLPFEVLSVLLLVAMVGVILLSKRDLK